MKSVMAESLPALERELTGTEREHRQRIVYDGTGAPGATSDVGIRGDRIAAVGALSGAEAPLTVDATNMAVAPGFINMLSWSTESLLVDGRPIA